MSKYKLPPQYVERQELAYFDDSQFLKSEIVH